MLNEFQKCRTDTYEKIKKEGRSRVISQGKWTQITKGAPRKSLSSKQKKKGKGRER